MQRNNNARKKTVFLHTRNRNNKATTTSTNCTIGLDETISHIGLLEPKTVSISHTIYNVNSSNNLLPFEDSLGAAQVATLVPSDYTSATLATEIGTQMTAEASDGLTYSATTGANTKKYTITNSGPTNFELTTTTTVNTIWDQLGYDTSADKTGAATYTADNVFDLNYGIKVLYILSKKVGAGAQDDTVIVSDGKHYDILVEVQNDEVFGGFITWRQTKDSHCRASIKAIKSIDLKVVGEFFQDIELNGRDWFMTMDFHHTTQN